MTQAGQHVAERGLGLLEELKKRECREVRRKAATGRMVRSHRLRVPPEDVWLLTWKMKSLLIGGNTERDGCFCRNILAANQWPGRRPDGILDSAGDGEAVRAGCGVCADLNHSVEIQVLMSSPVYHRGCRNLRNKWDSRR